MWGLKGNLLRCLLGYNAVKDNNKRQMSSIYIYLFRRVLLYSVHKEIDSGSMFVFGSDPFSITVSRFCGFLKYYFWIHFKRVILTSDHFLCCIWLLNTQKSWVNPTKTYPCLVTSTIRKTPQNKTYSRSILNGFVSMQYYILCIYCPFSLSLG